MLINTVDMSMVDVEYAQLLALFGATPDAVISAPDWPCLVRQAAQQEILPFLYGQARALPPALQPPAEIAEQLRNAYLHGVARSTRIFHGLARVLTVLREADVPIIVLKGAHLAALVYRDPAYRMMVDVDLLLHTAHLERARHALLKIGCHSHGNPRDVLESMHHEHYTLPSMRVGIEMHWTLERHDCRVSVLDTEAIWERAQPVTIAGVDTLVLAPDDLYVYLCQHIYYHGLRVHLRHVLDLAECVRAYQFETRDWERIFWRAQAWQMERTVTLLTSLVREWFCPQIPAAVLAPSIIPDGERGAALIAYAKRAVFQGETPDDLPSHMARLIGKRALHEKWAILCSQLFPSRVYMANRYHCSPVSPRLLFYYLARMWHMGENYGRRLFRQSRTPHTLSTDLAKRAALLDWLDGIEERAMRREPHQS